MTLPVCSTAPLLDMDFWQLFWGPPPFWIFSFALAWLFPLDLVFVSTHPPSCISCLQTLSWFESLYLTGKSEMHIVSLGLPNTIGQPYSLLYGSLGPNPSPNLPSKAFHLPPFSLVGYRWWSSYNNNSASCLYRDRSLLSVLSTYKQN